MSERTLFEEIKTHFEIVSFISQFVKLKKVGRNYVGLCPFHSERTPSFTVSAEKQIFKCFGCGAAGDVVTFYMKLKGLDFKEALIELAEKAGIKVSKSYFVERKRERDEIELNFKVAKIYQNFLWHHPSAEKARLYLKERGISEETIKTFYLGYAPAEGRVLASMLRAQKVDLDLACEAGLLKKENDGSYLDLFRDRIIFPIFNERGECVGFGGRALNSNTEPKYLNSPESKVFKKAELLYGLFQSKDFIKEEGTVFIVEGYFDFLSLWDKSIRNVVATCGTALTEKHLNKLKLLAEDFIIFYDGDKAGKVAAVKAISLVAKIGKIPKVILLPEDLDPDTFIQKNSYSGEDLKKEISQRLVEGFTFLKDFYSEDYKKNPGKVFKEFIEFFKEVEDPILLAHIAREMAFYFNIPETEILLKLREKYGENALHKFVKSEGIEENNEGIKIIAQYLVNYPHELPLLEEAGLKELLREEKESPYKKFLEKFIELRPSEKDLFFVFTEEDYQVILSDLLFSPPFENKKEVLEEIRQFIQKELKKREIRRICEALRHLERSGRKEEIETFLFKVKEQFKYPFHCKEI
ncbi:MAG: DNA primase [Caldimicrobium sp.]